MSRSDAVQPAKPAWATRGDPGQRIIQLDRYLVKENGLREMVRWAWPVLEGPSKPFVSGWHIDAICDHLTAVSNGDIKRLAISMPPRHMKSLSVSVLWLAWDWVEQPWRQFLFGSYAQSLAFRDSVKTRRLITSPWYRQRWGDKFKLTGDQNTKSRFENDKNGHQLSTCVGGATTGESGDIIVCLPPDAIITTERGARRIEDVVLGDDFSVASCDVETREIVMRPILRRLVNPAKALVEIETEDSRTLHCTEDHPVWVVGRGFIPAGDVQEGEEVLTCPDAFIA
jgi:Pretoxin HINT domain